jgi:hypothetical protein
MNMEDEKLIARRGRQEYLKFLKQEPLTYKSAVLAQCYICYIEGADADKLDCSNIHCPLYSFMPYNPTKAKRILTVEEKAKIRERFIRHTK